MSKVNLTRMGLRGLLWGNLSTVHLARPPEKRRALCGYDSPPEYPNPILLSAAPSDTICKDCLKGHNEATNNENI